MTREEVFPEQESVASARLTQAKRSKYSQVYVGNKALKENKHWGTHTPREDYGTTAYFLCSL